MGGVFVAQCGAKKKNGEICRAPAIEGGVRCRHHGGKARQAVQAAEARIRHAHAERALATLGLTGEYEDIPPDRALVLEVSRTSAIVRFLEAAIRDVSMEELLWHKTKRTYGFTDDGTVDETTEELTEHPLYGMFMKERAHLAKVSALALNAGIEERRTRVAESQAQLMAAAFLRTLNQVPLPTETRTALTTALANELRTIQGETP